MQRGLWRGALLSGLVAAIGLIGLAQSERAMTRATGTFEVKLVPEGTPDAADGTTLGRMSIDKQFSGDLAGISRGTMLTALTATQGSAGYVAVERVSGTLHGKQGSFVLQHSGTMTRGTPSLVVSVVPDSGTGELAGITGRMQIDTSKGHAYTFEYDLPAR